MTAKPKAAPKAKRAEVAKTPGSKPRKPNAPRPQADLERIEADYRAGMLSAREIAAKHDCTDTGVHKWAAKYGWKRDVSQRIRQRAEQLLAQREADSGVKALAGDIAAEAYQRTPEQAAEYERYIVEINAEAIIQVRQAQRIDISRARRLAGLMMREVEAQTAEPELYERLGEFVGAEGGEADDKRRRAFARVVGLSGRISNLRGLADAMQRFISLEREAYGLTGAEPNKPPSALTFEMSDDELIAIAASRGR